MNRDTSLEQGNPIMFPTNKVKEHWWLWSANKWAYTSLHLSKDIHITYNHNLFPELLHTLVFATSTTWEGAEYVCALCHCTVHQSQSCNRYSNPPSSVFCHNPPPSLTATSTPHINNSPPSKTLPQNKYDKIPLEAQLHRHKASPQRKDGSTINTKPFHVYISGITTFYFKRRSKQ
jgi:hypothetical protein